MYLYHGWTFWQIRLQYKILINHLKISSYTIKFNILFINLWEWEIVRDHEVIASSKCKQWIATWYIVQHEWFQHIPGAYFKGISYTLQSLKWQSIIHGRVAIHSRIRHSFHLIEIISRDKSCLYGNCRVIPRVYSWCYRYGHIIPD